MTLFCLYEYVQTLLCFLIGLNTTHPFSHFQKNCRLTKTKNLIMIHIHLTNNANVVRSHMTHMRAVFLGSFIQSNSYTPQRCRTQTCKTRKSSVALCLAKCYRDFLPFLNRNAANRQHPPVSIRRSRQSMS